MAAFGDDIKPYLGDLPGLAALNGLGADAGPVRRASNAMSMSMPMLISTDSDCVYNTHSKCVHSKVNVIYIFMNYII